MKKQIKNVTLTFESKVFEDKETKSNIEYIEVFAYINGEAVRLKVHKSSESLLKFFMRNMEEVK